MSTKDVSTSVFTDDSGSRKRVVVLAIRGAVCALGLGVATIAVSIVGQVTLPGLDAPLHIPGVEHARTSAENTESVPGQSSADSESLDPSTAPTEKPSTPANPTVGSTTSAPAKTQGKPTAKPTTAAHPVHAPGSPPTSPPGKSKTSDNDQ